MICDRSQVKLDMRRLYLEGCESLRIGQFRIQIVATPCHFGGERRWFLCPHCLRRCAVLYRADHRCRRCARGHYRGEHLSPLDRKLAKARKLRRKLGQDHPNASKPIPVKPPRMRWHTYQRVRSEILTLESEATATLGERLLRRSVRGSSVEARRHTIRPLPGNLLLRDHARRNGLVLAVKDNESGA